MQLADETGLYLQRGKMLFELRPGHAGKGSAVTHLLKATELGGGLPIFIGDDVTDEEGFLAATRHHGASILLSEEHTYELQSLMRRPYPVFCSTKKKVRIHIQ